MLRDFRDLFHRSDSIGITDLSRPCGVGGKKHGGLQLVSLAVILWGVLNKEKALPREAWLRAL
jgi:hypothetical protein